MISVRVTFPSGHQIVTSINGDIVTAAAYYVANEFQTGDELNERMESACLVEEL